MHFALFYVIIPSVYRKMDKYVLNLRRIYFGFGQLESDYYSNDSDFVFGIFLSDGDGILVSEQDPRQDDGG